MGRPLRLFSRFKFTVTVMILQERNFDTTEGLIARTRNFLWAGLGVIFMALGIIGAFLPVLPTTIFLILATWAFGKSCPALHDWLMNHPKFGPSVRIWFEQGAIPRTIKYVALSMMLAGYVFTAWSVPNLTVVLIVGATLIAVSVFIITRPDARL